MALCASEIGTRGALQWILVEADGGDLKEEKNTTLGCLGRAGGRGESGI